MIPVINVEAIVTAHNQVEDSILARNEAFEDLEFAFSKGGLAEKLQVISEILKVPDVELRSNIMGRILTLLRDEEDVSWLPAEAIESAIYGYQTSTELVDGLNEDARTLLEMNRDLSSVFVSYIAGSAKPLSEIIPLFSPDFCQDIVRAGGQERAMRVWMK